MSPVSGQATVPKVAGVGRFQQAHPRCTAEAGAEAAVAGGSSAYGFSSSSSEVPSVSFPVEGCRVGNYVKNSMKTD